MFADQLRAIYSQLTAAETGTELHRILLEARHDALAALRRAGHSESASKCLALKLINICLARAEFSARRTHVAARPFGIELDPCNGCALACPGCVHSQRSLFNWPQGMLSADRAAAFLNAYAPYAVQAMFYNYGEPLLNVQTPAFIRSAKRFLAQTVLSTSLSVHNFDADAYVASGLDYMLLSIDGVSQPVYSRFRKNGDINLVLRNISRLVDARLRAGTRFPVLAWQFLAFEHNRHEISAAIELAASLGVNEIRISPPFDVSWDDPELRPAADVEYGGIELHPVTPDDYRRNWNRFPGLLHTAEIDRAFDAGWPVDIDAAWDPPSAGHTCQWLYMNTVMDANGRILPCSCAPIPNANLVFGHVDNDDAFNSLLHRQARAHFVTGETVPGGPHCQSCEWFDDQRKTDIDLTHIRQYAAAVNPPILNAETQDWLAGWSCAKI